MRISISGAQGTGKTTLMNFIKSDEAFQNYEKITEIVRSLAARGIKVNKEADHYSQCVILEEHYKNILKWNNSITDRSSVDAFVYATWSYINGKFSFKEHKEHESLFLSCVPFYERIFYIPVEFGMENDGFRDTDISYQQEIARLFINTFHRYHIKYDVLTGTTEQRYSNFKKYF